MHRNTPPPGRPMAFDEWAVAIVACVRRYLPDVRASRKGSRLVILRYRVREAHLSQGSAECWITFVANSAATTMASMYDTRCDDFTVANFSRSIVGYFDPALSVPDR